MIGYSITGMVLAFIWMTIADEYLKDGYAIGGVVLIVIGTIVSICIKTYNVSKANDEYERKIEMWKRMNGR